MHELICPDCKKPIMRIQKVKNLLRVTAGKVLIGHCFCGVSYEIRSLKKDVLDVSTSSGKRSEQLIEGNEEQ